MKDIRTVKKALSVILSANMVLTSGIDVLADTGNVEKSVTDSLVEKLNESAVSDLIADPFAGTVAGNIQNLSVSESKVHPLTVINPDEEEQREIHER